MATTSRLETGGTSLSRVVVTVPECWVEIDSNNPVGSGWVVLRRIQSLASDPKGRVVVVDLRATTWADPGLLLLLLAIIGDSDTAFTLRVSSVGSNDDQRRFLRHLAANGVLLQATLRGVVIERDGVGYRGDEARNLISSLTSLEAEYFGLSLILVGCRLVVLRANAADAVADQVESIVSEVISRGDAVPFMQNRAARDGILQRLRKLLTELLMNVVEHVAAINGRAASVAICGRIRQRRDDETPPGPTRRADSMLSRIGSRFPPPAVNEWVEFFVADAGTGLSSHAGHWSQPGDDAGLEMDVKRFHESDNKLSTIIHRLFQQPVSRIRQRTGLRTSVTGLMHIGHMLAANSLDALKIYDGHTGQSVSGHLPFNAGNVQSPFKQKAFQSLDHVRGTCYQFFLVPQSKVVFEKAIWQEPTDEQRESILRSLSIVSLPNSPFLRFIDQREQTRPTPPETTFGQEADPIREIVFRPPRSIQKSDFGAWLDRAVGYPGQAPTARIDRFYFVDLSPHQAQSLLVLLKRLNLHPSARTDIYVVCEDWHVTVVTPRPQGMFSRFETNQELTRGFYNTARSQARGRLQGASLAQLLRERDSREFWEDINNTPNGPVLDEPVLWPTSDRRIFVLSRYLDLGAALHPPRARGAARRAMRRLLYLHTDRYAVAADELVRTLVEDLARERIEPTTTQTDAPKFPILVSSVEISGQTALRFKDAHDLSPQAEVTLLRNVDARQTFPAARGLSRIGSGRVAALNWSSPMHADAPQQVSERSPRYSSADTSAAFKAALEAMRKTIIWERVAETPFVAKRGDRHISVLRFSTETDARPLARKRPSEMYEELRVLDGMRFGHWHYVGRHELFSIHIGRIYELSRLQLGELWHWLRDAVTEAFAGPTNAVLLYPSHHVTDRIVGHLLSDDRLSPILAGRVVPIRFIGAAGASPQRIPPLTEQRIQQVVRGASWKAVLLDSSSVTGRTFAQLRQFGKALGATEAHTIAIVERNSEPYIDRLASEFVRTNSRYWQFDIPSLGYRKECRLCNALEVVSGHSKASHRNSQRRLTAKRWESMWRLANVASDWHSAGLLPVALDPPRPIKFGVTPEGIVLDTIKALDSTTLAAAVGELLRLTTRSSKGLEIARAYATTAPQVATQLLATQLLLFGEHLDPTIERSALSLLFEMACQAPFETAWTALACLILASSGKESKQWLWAHVVRPRLSTSHVTNADAQLAINILIDSVDETREGHTAYRANSTMSRDEIWNFIALGRGNAILSALSNVVSVLGSRTGSWHNSPFRWALEALCDPDIGTQKRKTYLDRLVLSTGQLRAELEQMATFGTSLSPEVASRLDSSLVVLTRHQEELRRCLESPGIAAREGRVVRVSESLLSHIYKDQQGLLALVLMLFPTVPKGTPTSSMLVNLDVLSPLRKRLEDTATVRCPDRLADGIESLMPKCADKGILDEEIQHYFDDHIRDLIVDTILNSTHATVQMPSPPGWPEALGSAWMWWRVDVEGSFLVLHFSNASERQDFTLKCGIGRGRLEAIGGEISIEKGMSTEIAGVRISCIETVIKIPLLQSFLQ